MIGVVRTILIDLCVVCSCLILSGCSWIYDNHYCCEINEEEGSFDVFSDWHECPDADPAGMAYMFFPVSGGEPWRFDFPKKDGGPLMLPDGVFHGCYSEVKEIIPSFIVIAGKQDFTMVF